MPRKDWILSEIRRLAAQNGGRPPGQDLFARETGVGEAQWKGILWRRWSEAQAEAGFAPNKFIARTEDAVVLQRYLALVRRLNAIPVDADLRLERRRDPSFPSPKVFRRFGKEGVLRRAVDFCEGQVDLASLRELLLQEISEPARSSRASLAPMVNGYVYLIRSGKSYKIGRTNASGRRLRELAIQLPTKPRTVHVIETDDPEGVEAYWHRRFAAKRQDGEWFLLSDEDVRAFRWRKFQ
jgi:hypothetical protein